MPLTDATIRAAKPTEKAYKLFDGGGLYLLVTPEGSRWWRLKYRFAGRERGISLGVYPQVGLREARARRDEARLQIAAGIDPSAKRARGRIAAQITFKPLAEEWLKLQEGQLAAHTISKARWTFDEFLFPALGRRPVGEITAQELLAALRKIEARGLNDTAHRARMRFSQVVRYAIATGRAERDVSVDLRGALAPVVTKNHAAITDPKRFGELLRAIDGYQGQPATQAALQLVPLVFLRSNELRGARWSEIDFDHALWRVPAGRMKTKAPHVVPLVPQSIEILRKLHAITGRGELLFPSIRSTARPISDNTLTAALRRLGYAGDEATVHGFRTTASTMLNESGWSPDLVELQLAHVDKDKVRAVYNKAERLDERRRMMAWWADHLDSLRTGKST